MTPEIRAFEELSATLVLSGTLVDTNAHNSHNRLLNASFGGRKARREWERQETKKILRSNKVEA